MVGSLPRTSVAQRSDFFKSRRLDSFSDKDRTKRPVQLYRPALREVGFEPISANHFDFVDLWPTLNPRTGILLEGAERVKT